MNPLLKTVVDFFIGDGGAVETIANKLFMDKAEKEKLEFTKEQFIEKMRFMLQKMNQEGDFKRLELEFKEAQAQRDYAQQQFGTAGELKTFFVGRVILLGRASIRWIITGYACWQTHRIISAILTTETIAALAGGQLSSTAIWLIALIVAAVVGVPLFYVAGISIEKLFKARGVI